MAIITTSLHGTNGQPDQPNPGASSAPASPNDIRNIAQSVAVTAPGSTKPLRLTLKERLYLLAQATGFKTRAL